jgi:hypothetical protein
MIMGDTGAKTSMSFLMLTIIGAGAAVVFFIFGLFVGKMRS